VKIFGLTIEKSGKRHTPLTKEEKERAEAHAKFTRGLGFIVFACLYNTVLNIISHYLLNERMAHQIRKHSCQDFGSISGIEITIPLILLVIAALYILPVSEWLEKLTRISFIGRKKP
jgi:hypothetical protein